MSRIKKIVKTVQKTDSSSSETFNPPASMFSSRMQHLHYYKPAPNPQGNRAERRAAKKLGMK